MWFAGAHADIGGSYKPDVDGCVLSNNSLVWMISQAEDAGLTIEEHLKDEFYDTKIGKNVRIARHALAIDEHREDFIPTMWSPRENLVKSLKP